MRQLSIVCALVVDDDPLQVEVLRDYLESVGVTHVLAATNGNAALRELAALKPQPDLIICDLQMPDSDGIELINGLAELGCQSQIVMVSGAAPAQLTAAANLAGVYGLHVIGGLRKPLAIAALDDLLEPFARVVSTPLRKAG